MALPSVSLLFVKRATPLAPSGVCPDWAAMQQAHFDFGRHDTHTVDTHTHTHTHTGATLVDIACDPELVKLSKSIGNVPVCVSSVEPEEFLAAVAAGADMVEIGNYDSFYLEGRIFSAEEVLGLTVRTREILGAGVPLSVTVPHTLPLDEQVSLAMELEAAGAHVIQTEV